MSSSRHRLEALPAPARLEDHKDPDDALVRRAMAGNRAAQEQLFSRYVRRVSGVVYRLLGHDRDLDDLVQDAFVQAFSKLHTLQEPRAFGPWLLRLATCGVIDTLRRRSLLRRLGLYPREELDTERLVSPHASPEIAAELRRVYQVLAAFPPDERVVLVLRRVEELTLEEIADYTGFSLATVKRRLVKAEARLTTLAEQEPRS